MDLTVALNTTIGIITGTFTCDCTELNTVNDEGPEPLARHVAVHFADALEHNEWVYIEGYVIPQDATRVTLALARAASTTMAIAPEHIVALNAREADSE